MFSEPFNVLHNWFRLSTDFDQSTGNTTGAACGEGQAYPSGAPNITLGFYESSYCSSFKVKSVDFLMFPCLLLSPLFLFLFFVLFCFFMPHFFHVGIFCFYFHLGIPTIKAKYLLKFYCIKFLKNVKNSVCYTIRFSKDKLVLKH